jgi:ribosomal protein S18 acetylase RimI-like enzyme
MISRRPVRPDDEEFLRRVYAGTRKQELAAVGWDDRQQAAFVATQFDAQHRAYQQAYPDATFDVVVVDGEPAGRLYLDEAPRETLIIDIALLPEFRGRGIGTHLLTEMLAEAATKGAGVTVHVVRDNPALRWYFRLGFALIDDQGAYLFLRRPPPPPP